MKITSCSNLQIMFRRFEAFLLEYCVFTPIWSLFIQHCIFLLEKYAFLMQASSDPGTLGMDEVIKLITEWKFTYPWKGAEGNQLLICMAVHLIYSFSVPSNAPSFAWWVQLLRAWSALYWICQKPYDQRMRITCDQCDGWYNFDWINLCEPPPKTYLWPACKPSNKELLPLSSLINHER